MLWTYARMIQKLTDVNDSINEACSACQSAGEYQAHNDLYKIREQVDKLIHGAMVKGVAEKVEE